MNTAINLIRTILHSQVGSHLERVFTSGDQHPAKVVREVLEGSLHTHHNLFPPCSILCYEMGLFSELNLLGHNLREERPTSKLPYYSRTSIIWPGKWACSLMRN